jgi:hypothetical protein
MDYQSSFSPEDVGNWSGGPFADTFSSFRGGFALESGGSVHFAATAPRFEDCQSTLAEIA